MAPTPSLNRQIVTLALPALATLITEPILVIVDSAIVGHLGTVQLAGLSIATNVVGIVVGLSVFLAYGTTAAVARRLGAGDRAGALSAGIDQLLLAALIGCGLSGLVGCRAVTIVGWYDASAQVHAAGSAYLQIVSLAFPGLLLTLASTGVLRGLQDTKTPLAVAIGVNLVNIALTVTFVYGLGWGIVGAATGTAIAATGGGLTLSAVVIRSARQAGASLRWRLGRIWAAARTGAWLLLRSAALQASITITTVTAATMGGVALAAHQVTTTIWNTMAFILDALAIAAQALIGHRLGDRDVEGVRAITQRVLWWGAGSGVVVGALLVATRPLVASFFSPDPAVQDLLGRVLLVLAVIIPLGGVVFILDGVLIGAGDMRYLGIVSVLTVVAYAPFAWAVWYFSAGLVWLWAAYTVAIATRLGTLWWRQRQTAWMRVGA